MLAVLVVPGVGLVLTHPIYTNIVDFWVGECGRNIVNIYVLCEFPFFHPNLKQKNSILAFCGDPFRGLWAPMWLPVAPLGRPAEGQGDLLELIGVGLNPRPDFH